MPVCRKCAAPFPNRVKIGGKTKVLSSRKFCLDCSPFGGNNRRKLDIPRPTSRLCVACGTSIPPQGKRKCNTCVSRERRKRLRDRLFALTGDRCIECGYGGEKCRCALDHHHRDPANKKFNLNVNNLSERPWEEVVEEAAKCVVLCCRCHRELHGGLLTLSA